MYSYYSVFCLCSTNQSGERRAVRITNPPGSNRGAELTLIFRRDGEIRRESTAAQTNSK